MKLTKIFLVDNVLHISIQKTPIGLDIYCYNNGWIMDQTIWYWDRYDERPHVFLDNLTTKQQSQVLEFCIEKDYQL